MTDSIETPDDTPLTDEELGSQLKKFSAYQQGFAADIERLEAKRRRLLDDIEEYKQLVRNVEQLLADGTTTFETRVDIGCDVSCAARVPDAHRLFVAVGLGFHVEVPLAEVAGVVEPRLKHLASLVKEVEEKLSDARACAAAFESSLKMLREGHAGEFGTATGRT